MKNLANCKPSEFLKQTNKIRKSVMKWLTDTDIMNIRKRLPELSEDATKEEKDKAMYEQAKKNLNAILDAILDDHPDETLELLALLCFVEPSKVDDYDISEYLDSMTDMINNHSVLNFFTSLLQLAKEIGLTTPEE